MAERWRILDTGLASASRNIALNRALLEARDADEIPSTLRFLRYAPAALLGSQQCAAQEFDIEYCAAHAIPVQRRVTGGAGWCVDPLQLGWELYLHRRDVGAADSRAIGKRIAHAAAAALAALGVDARYRRHADVEVDGRVLSMGALAAEGAGVLFQALLAIDTDFDCATRVLRLPAARGEAASALARERFVDLKTLLGRRPDIYLVKSNLAEAFEDEFGVELRDGDLTLSEHARYDRALREVETAGWVDLASRPASAMPILEGVHVCGTRRLRATLKYEQAAGVIREVWFSGDVKLNPRRTLADLEAVLRDVPMTALARQVERFFASHAADLNGLAPHDFIAAVRRAVGQPLAA